MNVIGPRPVCTVLLTLLLCLSSGCGGGGGSGGSDGSSSSSSISSVARPALTIEPATITVDANGMASVGASGGSAPYAFAVTTGGGTISTAGVYTAPASAGTASVTVTDSAGARATATITINPPLGIAPGSVAVGAGTTQAFQGQGGTPPYTYAISSGTGTIGAAGLYTAPTSTGTTTITVTDSLGATAQAAVTINPPLSVLPGSITMPAASGQSYAFVGQNGAANYQYRLLSGPGSLSAGGVYTAGATGGTATIQITDRQGTTATASVASVFVRTNGPVYSAATDGTNWYLGGSFSAVNAYESPHLAVIDTTDGSPNLGCDLQSGFDDSVLVTVSDGTAVYVGGRFSHYRGVVTPGGLVKINAATCQVLATYFAPGDQAIATYALFVSGSALYVNAQSVSYRGMAVSSTTGYSLIKVDTATGVRDTAFNVTLPMNGWSRIYVTGNSLYAGTLKYDATTGVYDPAFALPFNSTVNAFVASGTSLYVGGYFSGSSSGLIKVSATTGVIDQSFTSAVACDDTVYDLLLAGNSLYVAGRFTHVGTRLQPALARVDANTGAIDPVFASPAELRGPTQADRGVHAVLAVNGALFVAGNFLLGGGSPAMRIARLDATSGAIDNTFTRATGFNDTALTMTVAGNRLFVGGNFVAYRGTAVSNLARLNIANGAADAAFTGTHGTDGLISTLLLNGGALYLGGLFSHYDGTQVVNLAKVGAGSAALDETFAVGASGPDGQVLTMDTDGAALYVGGAFVNYRGSTNFGLVKLNPLDGSPVPGFRSAYGSGTLSQLVVSGQYLYATSSASIYGTVPIRSITRINTQNAALDAAFPTVPTSGAFGIAITTTTAGAGYVSVPVFTPGIGNATSSMLKFAAATGAADTAFAVSTTLLPTPVRALQLVGASLYAAATPTVNAGSGYGTFLAKLNAATGAVDTAFSQPAATVNAQIRVLRTTGTDLWVGGDFTSYRGGRGYYFVPVDPVTGAAADP